MWKMVAGDLYHGFKPGMKRFMKQTAYIFPMIFWNLLIAPLILVSGQYILPYYAAMLPMICALMLFGVYGGRVNKVFYLCPLSADERRKYFVVAWGIRAAIPVFLSVLFEAVLCVLHRVSLPTAFLVVLTVAFFSAAMSMYAGSMSLDGSGTAQAGAMPPGYTVWGAIVLLLGIFVMFFLVALVGDVKKPRFHGMVTVFMWILFFAHMLAVTFVTARYFRRSVRCMACYENKRGRDPQGVAPVQARGGGHIG